MNQTIATITKSKKTCILTGDFNINIIDYEHHSGVSEFYDNISAHGFRPLVLQPTRISSTPATLIDNIFINDLGCHAKGGNITSSISDHFLQFSLIDLHGEYDTNAKKTANKSRRNWRIFNKREFTDELSNIDWSFLNEMDTDTSCATFLNKVETLLNEMAPYKKITKKKLSFNANHGFLMVLFSPWTSEISFTKNLPAKLILLRRKICLIATRTTEIKLSLY